MRIYFSTARKHLGYCSCLLLLANATLASTFNIKWGTDHAFDGKLTGSNYQTSDTGYSSSYTSVLLKSLNSDGTLGSVLVDDVDLIELGFFDTDLTDDSTSSSISPNTSTTNLFNGVWTPLSTKTTIAQDWNTGTLDDGNGGEFYFYSQFSDESVSANEDSGESAIDWKVVHNDLNSNSLSFDEILDYASGTPANDNVVDDRVNALITASASNPVMLGIRFYDAAGDPDSGHGTTKYNTIMSTDWTLDWSTGQANLDLLEWTGSAVQVQDSLVFEFDNTDANTANLAKVGTGDTQVTSNDFVTTVTYHDGSSALNASTASHILSGLDGSGTITIGGDHTLTIHSNTGADRSFSGNIDASGSAGATTLLKTGDGKQILSGDVKLAGTNSGWLNVSDGTLSLAGSNKSYNFEYLTGSGGVLELNTTSSTTDIELGFANTTSSKSYDGNISMVAGEDVTIQVASGTAASDYNKEQKITGVISGSDKLIKTGVGRLVLAENNTNSGGVDIDDGTLVIGNDDNDADAGSGTITINKGKLEVLADDTVGNTISGGTGKSMIGGDGTITSVTVGSAAGEIDVISPGEGHSSSTSSAGSTQQVARNTSLADAIGSLTITTLNLNDGGVFDWEIGDFSGSTAGSDWDLLNVGTLNFDPSSSTMTVNILPLIADGSMGATPGGMWSSKTGISGFKFMDVTTWTNAPGSSQTMTSGFDINSSSWLYHKNDPYGDWSVYYDTGTSAFYLQYSAVPEPSTYIMVTGLLMVPGMSYVRRIRKKKDGPVGDIGDSPLP